MKHFALLTVILFYMASCVKDIHEPTYPTAVIETKEPKNEEHRPTINTRSIVDDIAEFYEYENLYGEYATYPVLRSYILQTDWNNLTPEDKQVIENFTEEDFAFLGMIDLILNQGYIPADFFASSSLTKDQIDLLIQSEFKYQNYQKIRIREAPWKSCLRASLGLTLFEQISDLRNLNGLNNAVKSQKAINILKAVGKRYLGWIGFAFMVHEFATCMNQ